MESVSLEERLEANRESMSPAALRVGRFLVSHPERALMATASELADAAETSTATVVRAVQTLGYAGLPELRREIGERIAGHYDRRTRWEDRFARVSADPKSVLDSLLHDATDLMGEMRSADHDEFLAAVKLLANADNITFFGWGAGGTMAEYAALGLVRLGCPATSVVQSGYLLADSLSKLHPGDLVVVLAPLLHLSEIDVVLNRASVVGARCILITEVLGEKLRGMVDHVLTLPSSQRFTISENLALLLVLDALLLGVAVSNPDRARSTWEVINSVRGAFSTEAIGSRRLGPATSGD
jgi:DNA-binding MurR/RpiR family transcriptional regulator